MKRKILRHWPFFVTGPLLALLLIVFWYFNQGYLSQDGSRISALLENPILTFGLIAFGAFISSFISQEYGLKTPVTYEPLFFSLAGGLTMGFGAVVASMSTNSIVLFNLAGIFNLTAFMITKGWIYAACMVLGGLAGAKIFSFLILRTGRIKKDFFIPPELASSKNQAMIFFALLGFLVLFVLLAVSSPRLGAREKIGFLSATVLLLGFGMIVERGTICMSSMLKEWFIAKSAYAWRSVLFTIMCLALFYQLGLRSAFFGPIQLETQVQNLSLLAAGSFLMGFGFIFADGCFIGSLWKAGQGNIINMVGIFGMICGIGAAQAVFKDLGKSAGAGLRVANYLDAFIHPYIFVFLLWLIGTGLLLIFRQKHYRY